MLLLAGGCIGGCSVVYDLQQDAVLSACEKIVDWNERKTCIEKNKMTFDQYEKQRKEILIKKAE